MSKVSVIGAGSWGTALALVLADNGYDVTIWARRPEIAEEINSKHTLEDYLPGVCLPDGIRASHRLEDALENVSMVLLVIPSHVFRSTARMIAPLIGKDVTVAHATKGFDLDSLERMSEVLLSEIPQISPEQAAVLSGPSHAEEVSERYPTTVVVASVAKHTAEFVQDHFMNGNFRVYTNPDVVGTELGGALKNIIALGGGISDGLGYGDNAKAALMTRGLVEISRLGAAMGASQSTFSGLAGVGDLIATCTSKHSRNWRAGYMLGQGKTLDETLANMKMVVEGVRTTKAAMLLSRKYQVEMPITTEIYRVLFEGKAPKDAVDDLMMRGKRHELEDIAKNRFHPKWKM
ncbi:NAD(P)H-dependent glycerol-3-phosphate dehydrogenase [Fodinisporobacter ferrooxydans]|uniref:Glycerol-3-phosphate dehydrogenase [NAD(P)+] n=1 Tax=Fodinisporobacter ferrooxydans TaxID=2901836 RepID=A0ABY4CHA5_9BACL|nr:NAD(P)H-dependent glycerol-3-phosphate dehydrogenase [Alicyclobacillaceae bacterium MYW30-H2]